MGSKGLAAEGGMLAEKCQQALFLREQFFQFDEIALAQRQAHATITEQPAVQCLRRSAASCQVRSFAPAWLHDSAPVPHRES